MLSRKIDLQRGVRQGDSLSPMLYIFCVEVLVAKIRNTPDIEGLKSANTLMTPHVFLKIVILCAIC